MVVDLLGNNYNPKKRAPIRCKPYLVLSLGGPNSSVVRSRSNDRKETFPVFYGNIRFEEIAPNFSLVLVELVYVTCSAAIVNSDSLSCLRRQII